MPGVRWNNGPISETHGAISGRPSLKQEINCERTQPDILNAFRCNPYTQPPIQPRINILFLINN